MESQRGITRRRALRWVGGTAALAAFPFGWVGGEEKPKRRILFFTKSAGFEHSVIKREKDELGHAEKVFKKLGNEHGFEVHATKDGGVFDKDLSSFDAFFFYTTGNLEEPGTDKAPPMSAKGKEALLEAVRAGKGLLGSHCATDTFHTKGKNRENQKDPDPYIAMIGGEFIGHGPQQKATLRVADAKFPGFESLGEHFEIHDEWYSLKNFAPDLHVLLVQETKGMDGLDYKRPPFPATWARQHGKGRVFYTSMGHREDVWTNPTFQKILLGGAAWATRNVDAEVPPNLAKVAPEASVLPPEK